MTTVYPVSDGSFQQDNIPFPKAQTSSNWFLELDSEFTVFESPSQSQDLSLLDHLWGVVEWEIYIKNVQLTNLQ